MTILELLKYLWRREPSGGLRRAYLIVGIVAFIVAILWYFNIIDIRGPKLAAVVDYGYWTTPCCIEEVLKSSNQPPKRQDFEESPAKLLDAGSMYHIVVRNKKGPVAKGAEVQIPYAYYIEVIENGEPNDHWQLLGAERMWYPLGNIKSKQQVEVNAWTTSAPDRKQASAIVISHDDGHVSPYVKTPVMLPAKWVNRYSMRFLLIAVVVTVVIWLLHKFKFCCKKSG